MVYTGKKGKGKQNTQSSGDASDAPSLSELWAIMQKHETEHRIEQEQQQATNERLEIEVSDLRKQVKNLSSELKDSVDSLKLVRQTGSIIPSCLVY